MSADEILTEIAQATRTCLYCRRRKSVSEFSKSENGCDACHAAGIAARTCPICGEEFEQVTVGKRRKYCSDKCSQKARRAQLDAIPKPEPKPLPVETCAVCGKSFEQKQSCHRHCSKECGYEGRKSNKGPKNTRCIDDPYESVMWGGVPMHSTSFNPFM